MITSPVFSGKKYAVLGLARSGLATVDALLASGAEVVAWDDRDAAREALAAAHPGEAGLSFADPLVIDLAGFAGVVVSPGVPIIRHPIRARAAQANVPLIGDIELFAQARASLPGHKIVGITGTNGKSTTTALIHHILKAAGIPTLMGGNIGLPILSRDPLPAGGVYVLELSSYQIDLTYSLACDVAVLLNVTPDHLDRYPDFEGYAASKTRLFGMQQNWGYALISTDDETSAAIAVMVQRLGRGQLRQFSRSMVGNQSGWPALQGPHNAQNVVAAVNAALLLGVPGKVIDEAVATYPGLPHRMERVAEKGGVLFVNDSKATNATSTAPALAAYPKIHWILGGLPKADDLDPCVPYFDHVAAGYTIGQAGPMFARILGAAGRPVTESGTLDQAVRDAAAAARPGEVVMLSPACASFDQFRDFEARGDAFRAAVEALPS
ncbi:MULTISPECIES: UDP-N-acetylmuramoyl-L-alanine--D-glutamate ligase [Sphingomonas]|uniref:UDP-N-acetylmuramoylalanine--D-glutamate ligase n=1 Tax=Edaphosphingomonas fennica TaxID=114404 RepID=A0A2T4I5B7_9SPHN|nr:MULTISPECIES: UDP-N-acetylmuramoyl-L-alanine--D-glutamate ligase [Sphingomonas]AGH48839.1 UDP-N-acetylmuramoylalanine--D-glutamate ligase [Sphingomonas sp. MM-1]PTD24991.1 UDP-N-acetylmuramoyl-L-alanine--D-glutamate ligase [Sphingomonas fennica]